MPIGFIFASVTFGVVWGALATIEMLEMYWTIYKDGWKKLKDKT
jgi:hypothetical protein